MCSDVAIAADHLRKVYQLYTRPVDRLKQIFTPSRSRYYDEFVAIDDLSFQVMKGEVLGIVGRNGAGKSTLLQLVCGTLKPTSGRLVINGRIAALLELGAGFNPEFTGRENVYLSGALMGMARRDVDALLDEIIDFAGVRPFIDQPVKCYSSGMYVRLAFSVATSVDPDILIIDEALSVGDGDFARSSFDRIMKMRDSGKTILFCSHALYQVESLCSHVIWMESGKVMEVGRPESVVTNYQSFLDRLSLGGITDEFGQAALRPEDSTPGGASAISAHPDSETGAATMAETAPAVTRILTTRVTVGGTTGKTLPVRSGKNDVHVEVEYLAPEPENRPGVAVVVHAASGQLISSCGTWNDGYCPEVDARGYGRVTLILDRLPLLKGRYNIGVLLFCARGVFLHDEADPVATLEVSQDGVARGVVDLPHRWTRTDVDSGPDPAGKHEHPGAATAITPSRWRVETVAATQESALLDLFASCFGHNMSPATWCWKYQLTREPGSAVYEGDRLVAFAAVCRVWRGCVVEW
ncbi:MAG: ABC transporter ATP-binding protein [Gammaproteobacteria bacterium]|nr:ABC transporter ATP-binding protein [Gammaproteobacteria bacterium]